MKTKAERRFTKRLCQENAQIFADSAAEDHPLHIFARDELALILEFRDLMETFEFDFPRILKQIHDFYVVSEIFWLQATQDGAPEDVIGFFKNDTTITCLFFEEIIRDDILGTEARTLVEFIRAKKVTMDKNGYMYKTSQLSMQKNPFQDVEFWQRRFLKTLRTRKQMATNHDGVPLLKYCYGVEGGDPWIQISIPGES